MAKYENIPDLDLTKFVVFNIKWLNFLGYFSPQFQDDSVGKYCYRIYASLFVGFMFVLSLLSQIGTMIDSFGDIEKMTEASFLLFTNIVQCFKLHTFVFKGSRIWKMVNGMNRKIFKPKNWIQYRMLRDEISMSNQNSMTLKIMCVLTCTSWGVSPFLDKRGSDKIRLPLSGWYPFSTEESPAFEIAYTYQIISTLLGGFGDLSMDTFMSGLIMVISAQLSLLNNSLQNMKTGPLNKQTKSLLENVMHYRSIIDFSNEFTTLFSDCITAQFIVSVIIICMSMFQMSLVSVLSFRFFAMLLYQTCMLLEIFLLCYYGNEVILKSDKLTESLYLCDWINGNDEFKKDLLFFMTRTQYPLKLYASGYFTLSLDTFKAIIKSSWSYFAVLNQVHAEKN